MTGRLVLGLALRRRGDTHPLFDPCSAPVSWSPEMSEIHIETLLDAHDWKRARWLLECARLGVPDDHRWSAKIALTWVGEGRLAEARAAIDRAAQLAPTCPEVMSIRATVLDALGEVDAAMAVLRALTEDGALPLMVGECAMEPQRAYAVLSDGLLRLARLHQARGEREAESECVRRHLALPNTLGDDVPPEPAPVH